MFQGPAERMLRSSDHDLPHGSGAGASMAAATLRRRLRSGSASRAALTQQHDSRLLEQLWVGALSRLQHQRQPPHLLGGFVSGRQVAIDQQQRLLLHPVQQGKGRGRNQSAVMPCAVARYANSSGARNAHIAGETKGGPLT